MQGYLNLKAYKEFDAENRADGWNAWLTFVLSPAAAAAPPWMCGVTTSAGRDRSK
jgi:hypothetical protein